MKCANCDNETGLMDKFCAKCGTPVPAVQGDQSPTIEFKSITDEDIQKDAATKEVIAQAEQEIAQAEQQKKEQGIILDGVDKTFIEVKPVDQPILTPLVAQVVEEPKAMPLPDLEVKPLPVAEKTQQPKHKKADAEEQKAAQPTEEIPPQLSQDEQSTEKTAEEAQELPNQEITLPRNMAPISTASYFLYYLLMAIPVLNIVLALIWSFSTKVNINRRNMARASLISFGIMICVIIILLSIGIFLMINSPNIISDFLNIF